MKGIDIFLPDSFFFEQYDRFICLCLFHLSKRMNEVYFLNKRIMSANYVSNIESIFKCPICASSMQVLNTKSLVCSNRHTFDFAKQGYVNLMPHTVKTKYSKELFEARKRIAEYGFFEPLTKTIAELINKHVLKNQIYVLDTGCGEGSHLANLCNMIVKDKENVSGVGIDISKEGILIAAKNHSNKVWAVADLANTPFKEKQFDVILNILSPSNYSEFTRILKNNGFIVKVVPETGYLKELRQIYFDEPDKKSYSNTDTIERFKERFQVIDRSRLRYKINLEKPFIPSLVQMTPLSWRAIDERVDSFLERESVGITVDMVILIGKGK